MKNKQSLKQVIMMILITFLYQSTNAQVNEEIKIKIDDKESKTVTKQNIDLLFTYYKTALDTELTKYKENNDPNNGIAIQDSLLDNQISEIFNKLIFGKSDEVTTASAFGLTVNEEKTAASVNINLPLKLKNSVSPDFVTLGLNATGKGKIFNFYNDEAWQNSASINTGFVWRLNNAARFYDTVNNDFKQLYLTRKLEMELLILETDINYKEIYSTDNYRRLELLLKEIGSGKLLKTNKVVDTLKANEVVDTAKTELGKAFKLYPAFKKLFETKNYTEAYTMLYKEFKTVKEFLLMVDDNSKVDSYIKKKLVEFDTNNVKMYGHNNLWWLDTKLALSNNSFNFTQENITVETQKSFSENVLGLNALASINWSRESQTNLHYFNTGLGFDYGSFMNSALINGTPQVVAGLSDETIVRDARDRTLGSLDQIEDPFTTGSLSVYYAWFTTKNKNIGFNASFSQQYIINKPTNTSFENNFTLLAGPLAKTADGSTFGIDVGFANAVYNTRIVNDFVVRVRVGIPFNIISEKKKVEATK